MIYIISGICVLGCIVIILFSLSILKENRKITRRAKKEDDDFT
jgi:hypothetical protein